MKRVMQLVGAGILVLTLVAVAAAQVPTPVIRIGDWVEIGNEVFMNFIATADIRFRTSDNWDWEEDVRDRVSNRSPTSAALYDGEGDLQEVEARLGVDMRYQKNLTVQVLAEAQYIMDGNLIDDRHNLSNPGQATSTTGIAQATENNGFHIERYWIDYAFPQTPLRMRVGADLWNTDQAGLLADDDPRFALFLELGQNKEIELSASYVLQNESARLGVQNDNDFAYYTFGASYSFRPHKVALDVAYFRDRYTGSSEQGANVGQRFDTFLISPSYTGTIGPIRALAQFSAIVGSADGNNFTDCSGALGFQRCDFDVFGWAVVAHLEANLLGGVIRPFIGLIWGSGDDDPRDDTLDGFMTLPQGEITLLTGNGHMNYLDISPSIGKNYGYAVPARANLNGSSNGNLFRHVAGNPFSDRLGVASHQGINTTYSNPGALLIPAGVHIAPVRGHQISLWYLYVGLTDVSTLRADPAIGGADIDDTLYHEIDLVYSWTLSRHFDIRLAGSIAIPADGVKDIAATQFCDGGRRCQGEDPALSGEIRFRSLF